MSRLDVPAASHHVMRRRQERCGATVWMTPTGRTSWAVYAGVVMPDHFHLLMRGDRRWLSLAMRS